jgi:hypothetical protein
MESEAAEARNTANRGTLSEAFNSPLFSQPKTCNKKVNSLTQNKFEYYNEFSKSIPSRHRRVLKRLEWMNNGLTGI